MSCTLETYETKLDWLRGRQSAVSASDHAGVLGLGYAEQTPLTIYETKVSDPGDYIEEGEPAEHLRIGAYIEPFIAQLLAESLRGPEVEQGSGYALYRSQERNWLAATPDGWAGDAPCELKNVGQWNKGEWDEAPPLKYQIKCSTNCTLPRREGSPGGADRRATLRSLRDRPQRRILRRQPDKKAGAVLVCVERRIPPEPTHKGCDRRVLERLFKLRDDQIATPEIEAEWAGFEREYAEAKERLSECNARVKEAKQARDQLENRLRKAIGAHQAVRLPDSGALFALQEIHRKGYQVSDSSYTRIKRIET